MKSSSFYYVFLCGKLLPGLLIVGVQSLPHFFIQCKDVDVFRLYRSFDCLLHFLVWDCCFLFHSPRLFLPDLITLVIRLHPIDPLLAWIPLLWRWQASILPQLRRMPPYLPSTVLLLARLWLILSIALRLLPHLYRTLVSQHC